MGSGGVDGTGSHCGALWDQMKQAGVKAYVFHPIRLWSLYKNGRRTHRKILVVDGALCFTGGVGSADDWLGNARNPKEYRDMQVAVAGPAAAQMQAIFSEDWTYTTGELLVGAQEMADATLAADADRASAAGVSAGGEARPDGPARTTDGRQIMVLCNVA